MYASNSALLNALAQQKIDFKQVLNFIDARYDFSPTAFVNGTQKNAANENQGSCKVFSFAQLNHLNQLDTLALFAEHYHAVRDNPAGTDHQNIRQFIHNGWQGIHFEGQALRPKATMDDINHKMAQTYAAGGSEFTEIERVEDPQPTENQPGAVPTPNPPSDELVENTQNLTDASDVKDADGSIDTHAQESTQAAEPAVNTVADTAPVEVAHHSTDTPSSHAQQDFDEKAEQAIAEAEAANSPDKIIPPAPGSSNTMNNETTFLHDNDSVTAGTASHDINAPDPASTSALTLTSENDTTTLADNQAATTAQQSGSGMSASELVEANAVHIAHNPAAFIEEDNTSTDSSEPATDASTNSRVNDAGTNNVDSAAPQASDEQVTTTELNNVDTDRSTHANTLASASASELVQANANHVAENPAAFIEEKNTDTDSSEPATDAGTDPTKQVTAPEKPPIP